MAATCLGRGLRVLPLQFGQPEDPGEPEGQVGWAPGSLGDDRLAGPGDWALRERPAEICVLSARTWGSEDESCALRALPFLVRTDSNIFLVEIYGITCDLTVTDLKRKGSHTKKFVKTHHAPPALFLEEGFAESFWGF